MSILNEKMHAHWGLPAFFAGVAALVASALFVSGLMMPEPEQSVGTMIGEIARDIRNAATGKAESAPAAEASRGFDIEAILMIVTPVLAGLATVLGGISLYRHEPPLLSKIAIALGVSAIVMQFVFWLALLICGVVLLSMILSNMDGILGG